MVSPQQSAYWGEILHSFIPLFLFAKSHHFDNNLSKQLGVLQVPILKPHINQSWKAPIWILCWIQMGANDTQAYFEERGAALMAGLLRRGGREERKPFMNFREDFISISNRSICVPTSQSVQMSTMTTNQGRAGQELAWGRGYTQTSHINNRKTHMTPN